MTQHKHCELIKAWADGAKIQREYYGAWITEDMPVWSESDEFRIKPEPKWYEQIPEHGVLCWCSDLSEERTIKGNNGKLLDRIRKFYSNSPYPFEGSYDNWEYATPLTNDEIRKFLREE